MRGSAVRMPVEIAPTADCAARRQTGQCAKTAAEPGAKPSDDYHRRTTRADILRVRAKRLTSIPHSIIASAAMLMASEQVKSELMNLGKVRTCLSMLSLVRTFGFLARPSLSAPRGLARRYSRRRARSSDCAVIRRACGLKSVRFRIAGIRRAQPAGSTAAPCPAFHCAESRALSTGLRALSARVFFKYARPAPHYFAAGYGRVRIAICTPSRRTLHRDGRFINNPSFSNEIDSGCSKHILPTNKLYNCITYLSIYNCTAQLHSCDKIIAQNKYVWQMAARHDIMRKEIAGHTLNHAAQAI